MMGIVVYSIQDKGKAKNTDGNCGIQDNMGKVKNTDGELWYTRQGLSEEYWWGIVVYKTRVKWRILMGNCGIQDKGKTKNTDGELWYTRQG